MYPVWGRCSRALLWQLRDVTGKRAVHLALLRSVRIVRRGPILR